MNTPVCDFLERFAKDDAVRLHMPGHKGKDGDLSRYDITEIDGADSLYEASGIIRQSELNASELFGADTFYSAEGSSLSIRAMLRLVTLYAASLGKRPLIAAARNAHKTFITSAVLLDFDVEWLTADGVSYLSCAPSPESIEKYLLSKDTLPTAIYLTSPDYLGNICDIESIARITRKMGVLLLVDNAHGAYLNFLPKSLHPIALGADICCDSAHKTLPALTGASYLHLSRSLPPFFKENAKSAMALFGSTSPSYLILASLDRVNKRLSEDLPREFARLAEKIGKIKERLSLAGYTLAGDEPMKITVMPKSRGYLGTELAQVLINNRFIPEFSDPDHLVLMPGVGTEDSELDRLAELLEALPKMAPVTVSAPRFTIPESRMRIREAAMAVSERIATADSLGRILAECNIACPPAVPIAVYGELIGEDIVKAFEYYGIKYINAVKTNV